MTQVGLIRNPCSGLRILNQERKRFSSLQLLNYNNANLKLTVAILAPPPTSHRIKELELWKQKEHIVSFNIGYSELYELINSHLSELEFSFKIKEK